MKEKIEAYTQKKSDFIDKIREVFEKTVDIEEKQNRMEVFDTLLLAATCKEIGELNQNITHMLPTDKPNNTITYIIKQLREINGFCTSSFSDNHEVYQDLFASLAFPTPEAKQGIRDMLASSISDMIFEKTNSHISNNISFV